MKNLIDDFVEILDKYHDAPDTFKKAAGYAIISATIGPFFKSTWVPKSSSRPNLFIILSSIPARTRRSNIQDAVDYVIKKVWHNDLIEEERQKSGDKELSQEQLDKISEMVEDRFIEEGSFEGLMDHLEETPSRVFMLTSREFGGVFRKMYDKHSFEQGVGLLLSKLFYGEGGKMYLSTRGGKKKGRFVPSGLYVVMFCGMQEFKHYISEAAVYEGLTRRTLIVYHKVNPSDPYKPVISEDRENFDSDLDEFIRKLIKHRNKIKSALEENQRTIEDKNLIVEPYIDAILTTTVTDRINSVDKNLNMKVSENPSLENITLQSGWEHLFRLASCYEIANPNIIRKPSDNDLNQILITDASLKKAEEFFDTVKNESSGEMDSILDEDEHPRNIEQPVERIYHIIADHPNGVTKTELENSTHWKAKDVMEYLLVLLRARRIHTDIEKVTKPKTIYLAGPPIDEEPKSCLVKTRETEHEKFMRENAAVGVHADGSPKE